MILNDSNLERDTDCFEVDRVRRKITQWKIWMKILDQGASMRYWYIQDAYMCVQK